MKAHKEAFCMRLKDFKLGQVDAPQLKLHVTPGGSRAGNFHQTRLNG